MPVTINGNGSITGLAQGGIDGTKVVTSAAQPAGSVIQIVEGSTTTQQTPTGQNFVLCLQKDITPSATANNIFISAVMQYGIATSNNADEGLGFKLTRTVSGTETTIYQSDDPYDVYEYGSQGLSEARRHKPIQLLDTGISTTSAATYKVYARDYSGGTATVCIAGAKSTIHLLEIKA